MAATETPTLTDFLLARIAEDEAEARWRQALANAIPSCERAAIEATTRPFLRRDRIGHPARVLAECEAKRRIVKVCRPFRSDGNDRQAFNSDVLELLALAYADHPDYRPEWLPTPEASR